MKHLESDIATMHPLLSWRSMFAGLLVSFFVMAGFLGLGLAIGGISMNEDTTLGGVSTFTTLWFGASALVSLFVGSFFATRVSKFQNGFIGSAQGLIIASLFLGFFVYQAGSLVGNVGSLAGNIIGGSAKMAGTGVSKATQNPQVRETFNRVLRNTIGDLNVQGEIETVAINVGNRLLRGDEESAVDYLAMETGISREEAQERLSSLRIQAEEAVGDAKNIAGDALKSAGWTLFLLVLFGAISAIAGGILGSRMNFRSPLSLRQAEAGQFGIE
jgi:hypothetical protein